MRSHFNPFTTANTLLMLRSHYSGSYLLVEGDTDARFFSHLVDNGLCKIVPAHGKRNLVETLSELEKRRAEGILGIVDADYSVLEGFRPCGNLLVTDTHDVETMILMSPALEKVLKEFLPGDKLSYVQQIGRDVRQALVQVGLPVGCLRWVSYRENLRLDFDTLPFDQFIDLRTLTVDVTRMIKSVRIISTSGVSLADGDYQRKIDERMKLNADPWHVCQGHDLVCILEVVLPVVLEKLIGCEAAANARKKAHASSLDRELRVAYEPEYFVRTRLCISIQDWELANKPYKILATN